MARTQKSGLDYFPLDVDIFENAKIEAIAGEFGVKGELLVIKLLCAVYKNGYYVVWNDLLKMQLMKRIQGASKEFLEQVVNRLVAWGVFEESLFNSDMVLTSVRIQENYKEATKRRKEVVMNDYCLLNVYINPQADEQNVYINPQSKEKKSKLNKSKIAAVRTHEEPENLLTFYQENFGFAGSFIIDDLQQNIEEYGHELVKEALVIALQQNKSYKYAQGVLNSWRQKGIKTLEQARAEKKFHQKNQTSNSAKGGYYAGIVDF